MADVVFNEVDKFYENGFHAVQELSLEVQDGEFLVLVGPSGCGKTTALRMVAGLEDISGGELLIGSRVVNDLTLAKQRYLVDVARVFYQTQAQRELLTVARQSAERSAALRKASPPGTGFPGQDALGKRFHQKPTQDFHNVCCLYTVAPS